MNVWSLLMEQLKIKSPPKSSFYSQSCLYCGSPLPHGRKKYCTNFCQTRFSNVARPKTRAGRKEIVRKPKIT